MPRISTLGLPISPVGTGGQLPAAGGCGHCSPWQGCRDSELVAGNSLLSGQTIVS